MADRLGVQYPVYSSAAAAIAQTNVHYGIIVLANYLMKFPLLRDGGLGIVE